MNDNNIFNSNNNYRNNDNQTNNNEYQEPKLYSNQQPNNQTLSNNIYQQNTNTINQQTISNELQSTNINNVPTNDFKKNKLIIKIGLPIITICVVFIVISNFIGNDKNQNTLNNSNGAVNKNNSTVVEAKYKSSLMNLDNELEEINGNIKDIGGEIIITNDNKVYRISTFDYLSKIDVNIEKIIDNSTYGATTEVLLKNKDNTYSIYNIYNSKINATFNANNIIFATASGSRVYTLDDGYLYYSKIENGKLVNNKNRLYLNIAESTFRDRIIYEGKVEFLNIITDSGYIYFRLEDGTIKSFNVTLTSLSGTDYLNPGGMGDKYLEGKEPQNIYGVYSLYGIPYYSIKGDNTHLYYTPEIILSTSEHKKCIASKTENECYDEQKLTFNLPDEYDVNDIEKVYNLSNEKNILIVMKDDSIYYYKDGKRYTNKELNNLNKDGHIKKLYIDSNKIYALCDDSYIYEISNYQLTLNGEV